MITANLSVVDRGAVRNGSERANEADGHTRPRRGWAQLSVRALMGVVLALAFGFWWFDQRATVQRRAVAGIIRVGGAVFYDVEADWIIPPVNGEFVVPKWLACTVGIDHFGTVVTAGLPEGATDQELHDVGKLRHLVQLVIHSTRITDEGLSDLTTLASLGRLELDGTPISDAGLVHLMGLKNLYALSLVDTNVTDIGLPRLKGLSRLSRLVLPESVSEDAARKLQGSLPKAYITRGYPDIGP